MKTCKDRRVSLIGFLWFAAFTLGFVMSGVAVAHAQMMNEPWGFTQQNRASIAALMKQTEDSNNSTTTAESSGGYDQLICGSDGASSATGNSTCIILNNSNGDIQIGQDAQGNQDSTNNAETSTTNTLSDALGGINDLSQ